MHSMKGKLSLMPISLRVRTSQKLLMSNSNHSLSKNLILSGLTRSGPCQSTSSRNYLREETICWSSSCKSKIEDQQSFWVK